jgi:hypothetical protein
MNKRNRDYVVDRVTGYGLEDRRVKEFSLLHVLQTGSGVHPTSYAMGTGAHYPGVKWLGREADHSPPASAEIKEMWIYSLTPPYTFMV